jgi:hypothetical protein
VTPESTSKGEETKEKDESSQSCQLQITKGMGMRDKASYIYSTSSLHIYHHPMSPDVKLQLAVS